MFHVTLPASPAPAPSVRAQATDTADAGHSGPSRFRPDIEGMRALAVVLVVAFHAGARPLSGGFVGVDVFFVLSGFLITGLLVQEVAATGTISLARFYGRRIRRLLPTSTVALIATAVAAVILLGPLEYEGLGAAIASAAAYVSNWYFAAESFDYLGDPNKSPVLHFWSLSVEEQFYALWPLTLLVLARAGRPAARRAIRRITIALVAIVAGSLLLSIALTPRSAPFAYFGLHTRAWELAAGGLLALFRPGVGRLSDRAATIGSWAGAAMIVWAAAAYDETTAFPGAAAVVPVAGALLLIGCGEAGSGRGIGALLSRRPVMYVGRLSYGWYVWHWPCIAIARSMSGPAVADDGDPFAVAALTPGVAVAAVSLSFVLAALTHHLFEDRIRRSAWLGAVPRRSLALGAGLTAIAIASSAIAATPRPASPAAAGPIRLRMEPSAARDDYPTGLRDCYVQFRSEHAGSDCTFGDARSRTRVALVGDSLAMQWFPGLKAAAESRRWRLGVWTKAACPFVDVPTYNARLKKPYDECVRWRRSVIGRLRETGPYDLVLLGRSNHYLNHVTAPGVVRVPQEEARRRWREGWKSTLAALDPIARQVAVIRDTPVAPRDVPACLASSRPQRCAFPRARHILRDAALYEIETSVETRPPVWFLEMTPHVCPRDPCPVVSDDGLIIYRDRHHLTGTFVRSLADELAAAIEDGIRLRG